MKKDIEWLVKMINEELDMLRQKFESGKGTPNQNAFDEGRRWALSHVLRMMYYPDKLEELSKELPVIPKYVAEYLEFAKSDVPLKRVMQIANTRDEWPKWRKEYDWISANDETFAKAWLEGYEVEEEQKYYVDLDTAAYVAKWNGNDHVDIYTYDISGSDELEFHLTEQEIKNFDERFWPFAVKVEEENN